MSTIDAPPPRNTLAFAGQTGGPFDIFALLSLTKGIDSAFRAMTLNKAFKVDTRVEDSIRNIPNNSVAFDTLATNINRGRMNGIETYLQLRAYYTQQGDLYGLPGCHISFKYSLVEDPLACFEYITGAGNSSLAVTLKGLYRKVSDIDAWPGLMVEPHVAGSSIGTTTAAVIANQFTRLRDGDRFYYKNGWFNKKQLAAIKRTSFFDIVNRNTKLDWTITTSFNTPENTNTFKASNCP